MEVYLDILFLENIVINYLILLAAAKFSKSKTSNFRMLLGAFVGALYLIIVLLLPNMKIYTTVLAKILLSCAIVAVSFNIDKISTFFKTLAIFYVVTFIFAGAGFALMYFNQSGGVVKNGVFITTKQ